VETREENDENDFLDMTAMVKHRNAPAGLLHGTSEAVAYCFLVFGQYAKPELLDSES